MTSNKYSSNGSRCTDHSFSGETKTLFWWAQTTSVGDKDTSKAWFFSPLHFFLILQPVLISISLSHSVGSLESVSVCQLTITPTIPVWTSIPTPRHAVSTINTRHHSHLSCYIPSRLICLPNKFCFGNVMEWYKILFACDLFVGALTSLYRAVINDSSNNKLVYFRNG
jgi:hypothetical protein